jgi:CTP:molybdopterin cytidylyltransferase MocA
VSLPPIIWLAGAAGYDQWAWVRGVMAAHRAGCAHQVLVVERGLPAPNLTLGGKVEVAEVDAAARKARPGMLGTLQVGLTTLGARCPGPVFVGLAARPLAAPETYKALAEELSGAGVGAVKPRAEGKHGHPILLGEKARQRALELDPATRQVRDLLQDPHSLDVEDQGILAS